MQKYDYSIQISGNTGCYNEPYKLTILFQLDEIEIQAIKMKNNIKGWVYKENHKIELIKDTLVISTGYKDRLNLSQKINKAVRLANTFFNITDFERNVTKKLLEK